MRLEDRYVGRLWCQLLEALIRNGKRVSPRAMPVRELTGVSLYLEDARNNLFAHPARNLPYKFLVAEWLWLWFGRDDVASISRFNPNIAKFSDDGERFFGAYGPRLFRQLDYMINALRRDPDSRQCVANIWRESPSRTKDVPCTLSWQLLLRDGRLNGIVTMRSSDVYLGIPPDIFNFTMLQNAVAAMLGVKVGSYQLNIGSSHLYESNVEMAKTLLSRTGDLENLWSPTLLSVPPPWLEDALTGKLDLKTASLEEPWHSYCNVLNAKTNKDALVILRALSK